MFSIYKNYRSVAKLNYTYVENIISNWFETLPYIKPYYAVKSFPKQEFISFLSNYKNIGFDCASKYEIECVKKANITNTVIFANPTKSKTDIKYSAENNIHIYVIDSIEEIQKIENIDNNAKYIVRIISDELYSAIKFNKKFGACYDEVIEIIQFMSKNKINLYGFSYHVGSKCSNMKAHTNTLHIIIDTYLQLCYEKKLYPQVIDIGGGFENENQLLELHKEITNDEKNILQTLENMNIELIAEPGRLFSQGALDIYTKIIAIREKNVDHMKTLYITINDSVYHSFQGKIYDGQTYEPVPLYETSNELVRCIIFGQTCDSLDIIAENVILPYPKLDDILLFTNIGSYSLASAEGRFNGFECADMC